jgi:hypothetical protein
MRNWVVSLSMLAALGFQATSKPPRVEGYPGWGEQPTVTLLAPGAAPRTALRYAVAAKSKAQLRISVDVSMAMSMDGNSMPAMDMPQITMDVDFDVTDVAANGDISYAFAFTGMTVNTSDPNMQSVFGAIANDIKNVRGTAVVTNRGVTRSLKLNTDTVSNPQLQQTLSSTMSSLENLSMPLPEEAVGAGARWEVRQSLSAGGMHQVQKGTYELVSSDGKAVSLKLATEQMAPAQAVTNPMMPPGTQVMLQKLTGSGSGTVQLRLDSLVPSSQITQQSSTVMELSMSGMTQVMNSDTTVKVTVGPRK